MTHGNLESSEDPVVHLHVQADVVQPEVALQVDLSLRPVIHLVQIQNLPNCCPVFPPFPEDVSPFVSLILLLMYQRFQTVKLGFES